MSQVVVGYLPDLMAETRVRQALASHKAQFHNLALDAWPDTTPRLVIVAFGRPGDARWEAIIAGAKARWPDVPIVAFGPHVALDARQKARSLGATLVLARGRFFEMLPTLLASYLSIDPHGCNGPPHPLLIEGVRLFNQGEFYDCHEVLEDAWRSDLRPCRHLYQGILQLGVALYHIQRGNARGARKVLARALRHLRALPPSCQGIDVDYLLTKALAIQEALARGEPQGSVGFQIPGRWGETGEGWGEH